MQHRFILDNDGSNIFFGLDDDIDTAIADTVRECAPNITTYFLCSAAGTTYYPTKVGRLMGKLPGLHAAVERGLDPFGALLRAIKKSGKETFITLRMNDVHNPTEEWNLPPVRQKNPDCIVGLDEVKAGKAQWMSYCMDYARPEVRAYMLALIAEQIERYGDTIDGFQLDWMRFPRHLSGDNERVWAQRDVLTGFVREVAALLRKGGRSIKLAARIPTTVTACKAMGIDVPAWTAAGVELLVACPFLTSDWQLPIDEFRAWIGAKPVPIYAGFDFHFGRQSHIPESLRGICASLHDCKPDGIYLFNFPCWSEYIVTRPYHWLAGIDRPETIAKPILLAVMHRQHRIAGVDQEGLLPVTLAPGQSLAMPIYVPSTALPSWRGVVLVESHGDVKVDVNNVAARPIVTSLENSSPNRSEIFVEFIDRYWDKNSVAKAEDCRNFRIDPAALRTGTNELRVTNVTDKPLEIGRANLALW